MNFKTKRIRRKNEKKNLKYRIEKFHTDIHRPHLKLLAGGIIIGIICAGILLMASSIFTDNTKVMDLIRPLSKKVKVDSSGHTNFLLLGTGTEEHEGSYLTDTIVIASLDHDNQYLGIISFPRDLYAITDFGSMRINQIYETGVKKEMPEQGLKMLKKTMEKISGVNIHYYAMINFDGFVQAIDAIEGIDIYIDQTIIDTSYPNEETYGYETFTLEQGLQHLNGETALKYSRTRKCNICFDGDTGRAKRQQKIINAAKEKLFSTKTLLSAENIKTLLNVVKNNFKTDLEFREILYLATEAKNFPRENIEAWVINDDPDQAGGFLYVPERKYYNGAFIFLPQTSPMGIKKDNPYYEINDFAELVLKNTEIMKQASTLFIQNSTTHANLAAITIRYLKRYGFNPIGFGNAEKKEIAETTIYYTTDEESEILSLLQKMIPGEIQKAEKSLRDNENSDIIIVLGQDFIDFYENNAIRFY